MAHTLRIVGLRVYSPDVLGMHSVTAEVESEELLLSLIRTYTILDKQKMVLLEYMSYDGKILVYHGLEKAIGKEHMGIDGWI